MSDPAAWPVAPVAAERVGGCLDGDDRPERHRVYRDERSGPRPGRDIDYRDDGDTLTERPRRDG